MKNIFIKFLSLDLINNLHNKSKWDDSTTHREITRTLKLPKLNKESYILNTIKQRVPSLFPRIRLTLIPFCTLNKSSCVTRIAKHFYAIHGTRPAQKRTK